MKFTRVGLLCWLASTWIVSAQVKVSLILEQQDFLPREPLIVGLRIENYSGQTIALGQDNEWLSFTVENSNAQAVERLSPALVKGAFSVEASQMATRYVNLTPHYNLTKPGRYRVVAMVRVAQWDQVLVSPAQDFNLVPGTKIWEQKFGVPAPAGATNAQPVLRKYSLIRLGGLRRIRLYMQLSDPDETQVYEVAYLGPMVSFSRTETLLDKNSHLHVLYQSGARKYLYAMFSPVGEFVRRQTHEQLNTRPTLITDHEGTVRIVGGIRRMSPDDLPKRTPPEPVKEEEEKPAPSGHAPPTESQGIFQHALNPSTPNLSDIRASDNDSLRAGS